MDTTSATLAPIADLINDYKGFNQPTPDKSASDVDKQMFLELLVAQIRNQDPLNPADSMEYVSQLAEFSSLEQMIGIREEVQSVREVIEAANAVAAAEEIPPEDGETSQP